MNDATGPERDEHAEKPDRHTKKEKRELPKLNIRRLGLIVGVVIVVLLLIGAFGRVQTYRAAAATQNGMMNDPLPVRVALAKRETGDVDVTLPAQTQPFDAASIYARATGYIAERRVDIGSRVKKGDLLVLISAPDTDAQLAQAQAQLAQMQAALLEAQSSLKQAQANNHLAGLTKDRSTTLAGEGWATRQTSDNDVANASVQKQGVTTAQAGIAVAAANIQAQQATVNRLTTLVGYERVVAPFDGVITARRTDIGDLVQADSSGGTSMFDEQDDNVLRASVYVPQAQAIGVHDGIEATVTVPEMPGQHFRGRVSRSAAAIDIDSRSMLTEVDIPNQDHRLRAGLYVQITFAVPRSHPAVTIPDAAVIFNGQGLMAATIADGRVHLTPITIDRDFGTVAELSRGLDGGEQVIIDPPSDIAGDQKVKVENPPSGKDTQQAHAPRA